MRVETIANCPDSVSVETLSAWRDATLPAAEQQRLTSHINSCAACRERLNEYDRLANALAAIYTPPPIGGYGRIPLATREGRAASSWRRSRASRAQPRWRIAGSAGALAAAVLLTFAFVQVFHTFAPRTITLATPQPTPTFSGTPQPGPTLAWKSVKLPFSVVQSGADVEAGYPPVNFAVAPTNSLITYGCSIPRGGHEIDVWATQNGGTSWRLIHIPLGSGEIALIESTTLGCGVQVDGNAPGTVLINIAVSSSGSTASVNFVTFNGGVTWNKVLDNMLIFQTETVGATTYATLATLDTNHAVSQRDIRLVVSQDQLRHWTVLDSAFAPLRANSEYLDGRLWLNADGSLLVETLDTHAYISYLYEGTRNGQQWNKLPITDGVGFKTDPELSLYSFALQLTYIVQPSSGTHPWRVCAINQPQGNQPQAGYPSGYVLTCSLDGGKTWHARPYLALTFPDPEEPSLTVHGYLTDAAFTSRGDIVGHVVAAMGTSGLLPNIIADPALYRLAVGASNWQSLGNPPVALGAFISVAPTAGGDVLWTARQIVNGSTDSYGVGSGVAYIAPYPA